MFVDHTRVVCCAINAVAAVFIEHGQPLPGTWGHDENDEETFFPNMVPSCDGPDLTCGCNQLTVWAGTSNNTTPVGSGNIADETGCNVTRRTTQYHVHLARPICLEDPTKRCGKPVGDCCDHLDCGDTAPPMFDPADKCGEGEAGTIWDQVALTLRDRELLERYLAAELRRCICEGVCPDSECDGCKGCTPSVRWSTTNKEQLGDCVSIELIFDVTVPQ